MQELRDSIEEASADFKASILSAEIAGLARSLRDHTSLAAQAAARGDFAASAQEWAAAETISRTAVSALEQLAASGADEELRRDAAKLQSQQELQIRVAAGMQALMTAQHHRLGRDTTAAITEYERAVDFFEQAVDLRGGEIWALAAKSPGPSRPSRKALSNSTERAPRRRLCC